MIDHIVTARSMMDIREIVQEVKVKFGLENTLCFPVVKFFDNVLPDLFPDYRFLKCEKDEMNGEEAYTDHINKIVKIRVDVYKHAIAKSPRELFTIAHEIGHLFLHAGESMAFARTVNKVPAYKSAEWQANYFAAELLMSSRLIIDMEIDEIAEKCSVSLTSASIQLSHALSEMEKGKL